MQHCQIRVRNISFYLLWTDVELGLNFVQNLYKLVFLNFPLVQHQETVNFARFTPNKLDSLELNAYCISSNIAMQNFLLAETCPDTKLKRFVCKMH